MDKPERPERAPNFAEIGREWVPMMEAYADEIDEWLKAEVLSVLRQWLMDVDDEGALPVMSLVGKTRKLVVELEDEG